MAETPRRVADAFRELLEPLPFGATTFANEGGYGDLVVVRDIPFHSLCKHHLLPFVGIAHIGYVPADRIMGLSKFARIVDHFSRRLQIQEDLTQQIANEPTDTLRPHGVGVVMIAEHACMSLRGANVIGTSTVTSALRGRLREDGQSRQEFLSRVGN